MKIKQLQVSALLLGALLLGACGQSTVPSGSTGGDSTGGTSTGGNSTPTGGTSTPGTSTGGTSDTTGYPYNPDANAEETGDPRTPYYGDWIWAAVTGNAATDTYVGAMNITEQLPATDTTKNASDGQGVWCSDNSCKTVIASGLTFMGTLAVDSHAYLSADMTNGNDTSNFRWVMIDDDGKVTPSENQRPSLEGVGQFSAAIGSSKTAYIVIEQVDTTPDTMSSAQKTVALAAQRGYRAMQAQGSSRLNVMKLRMLRLK